MGGSDVDRTRASSRLPRAPKLGPCGVCTWQLLLKGELVEVVGMSVDRRCHGHHNGCSCDLP
jgi:hypothetical protein